MLAAFPAEVLRGRTHELIQSIFERLARERPTVLIIEAMKTEIAVKAQSSGRVHSLRASEGDAVTPGAPLLWLSPA